MATTWENEVKSDAQLDPFLLEIGDGFELLIDTTYKLEIQSAISGTTWENETKN